MEYNSNAQSIREANEICKMLGKNISFKQCIIQNFVDDRGRAMTLLGGGGPNDDLQRTDSINSVGQMKEEL